MISNSAAGLPEPAGGALRAFLNRPDHLTRAARELSQWEDAVRLATEAQVAPGIAVVRDDLVQPGGVPFLSAVGHAQLATQTILNVVAQVREAVSSRQ
jgi:hypothetical protein